MTSPHNKTLILALLTAIAPSTTSASFIRGAGSSYNDLDRMHNYNNIQHLHPDHRDLSLQNTKIIGGEEAKEDRYSYVVSLSDPDFGHFCGASLIAPDVVLSAAHCQGGSYQAIVGRHGQNDTDGETLDIRKEIPHPDYDDLTTNNDFMLLFLKSNVTVSVKMVQINPNESVPVAGDAVTVVGWGDTDPSDEETVVPTYLQEVEVNIVTNEVCNASDGPYGTYEASGGITENMMCAKDNGEDSCQGDSGGPLVITGADSNGADDIQVGIVSWGFGCAMKEYPGVYSRVSSAYEWIRVTVCQYSTSDHGFNCDNVPEPVYEAGESDILDGDWELVFDEGFYDGFGVNFVRSGNDARHYTSAAGMHGVVRVGGGSGGESSFKSTLLKSDSGAYSFFKITAIVRADNMEDGDNVCLDFTGNNNQNGQKCWGAMHEIKNDEWKTLTYIVDVAAVDELEIAVRISVADGDNSGLLIDQIKIEAEA